MHAPREDGLKSRWDEITGAENTPAMPDPGRLSYLVPLFGRLGRAVNNGFGVQAVPHAEVEAFCRMERLSPEEGRALRACSDAYVAGIRRGHDIFAIPPWDGSDDD